MKHLVSTVLLLTFVQIHCEECPTNNFLIEWQITNLDQPKQAKIYDDNLEKAKIIRTVPNQRVTKICANTLRKLQDPEYLFFNNSGIEEIQPQCFKGSQTIIDIDLSDNNVSKIEEEVFSDSKIKILNLRRNKIKEIVPTAFDNMTELLLLDLSFNQIQDLPMGWLKNTPKLFQLYLGDNNILALKDNIFNNLKGKNSNNLLRIFLERNNIEFIEVNAFNGLELKTLSLLKNKLEIVNGNAFAAISHVKTLILRQNQIKCITNNLDFLSKVDNFEIKYNPWNCTCLEEIENWYENHKLTTSINFESIDCFT